MELAASPSRCSHAGRRKDYSIAVGCRLNPLTMGQHSSVKPRTPAPNGFTLTVPFSVIRLSDFPCLRLWLPTPNPLCAAPVPGVDASTLDRERWVVGRCCVSFRTRSGRGGASLFFVHCAQTYHARVETLVSSVMGFFNRGGGGEGFPFSRKDGEGRGTAGGPMCKV